MVENQRSFQPFAVGPFWVHPSHNAEGQPAGSIALRIDAGMAFGTGTHATTRGCLEMLATLDAKDTANAVDVGCGSALRRAHHEVRIAAWSARASGAAIAHVIHGCVHLPAWGVQILRATGLRRRRDVLWGI